MIVAVTGGSGIVGTAVVRHLLASGHEVTALARSAGAATPLEEQGARVVRGDVLEREALRRLMEGSQWVFHVAGVNELCPRDRARMWKVNVEAISGVVETCRQAGVRRLIHTSSAATIGEEAGTVGTEDSKHRGFFLSEYERSKTVGERLILDARDDLEVISVNPSSVQGPGRATGTGALLLAAARGRLPLIVDTTFSFVDIDDCARGHLLAAEKGRSGERYILSGATLSTRQTVRTINSLLGRHKGPWGLDPDAVTWAAPLVDRLFRVMGKESPLCAESVRVLRHGHRYDGTKATRDLGMVYTPSTDTFERTLGWFREEGLLD
ncbi:MAG TPA: NAD-dependent epimerase/dehydratase family protein [Acidimicrobiia bacterium]|nr:NAD-dependent epimerase/dehydratase family protein [Acidimicrobiia bacterium]